MAIDRDLRVPFLTYHADPRDWSMIAAPNEAAARNRFDKNYLDFVRT